MKKSKIAALALVPTLLCGCATKCSFADFQKKVGEIDISKVKMTRQVIKGIYKAGGKEYQINYDTEKPNAEDVLNGNIEASLFMLFNQAGLYIVEEDKNATYFAGSSFKIEFSALKIEWDKYGFCTKLYGDSKNEKGVAVYGELTASYTYESK